MKKNEEEEEEKNDDDDDNVENLEAIISLNSFSGIILVWLVIEIHSLHHDNHQKSLFHRASLGAVDFSIEHRASLLLLFSSSSSF